jgi:hypothetical protein
MRGVLELGVQADRRLTPQALYRSLDDNDEERQSAYRVLFRAQLDRAVIDNTGWR